MRDTIANVNSCALAECGNISLDLANLSICSPGWHGATIFLLSTCTELLLDIENRNRVISMATKSSTIHLVLYLAHLGSDIGHTWATGVVGSWV